MFELKPLTREAIPSALEKANRYRLLNEPGAAESIYLDILAIDPDNQEAIVNIVLSMSDRFSKDYAVGDGRIQDYLAKIDGEYERTYYTGIVYERRAKAHLAQGTPGGGPRAYEWLREAMSWYERAEAIRPSNNDDALLRWNACARLIMRDRHLVPVAQGPNEPLLLE